MMGGYLDWSALPFLMEYYQDEIPNTDDFMDDLLTMEQHRNIVLEAERRARSKS